MKCNGLDTRSYFKLALKKSLLQAPFQFRSHFNPQGHPLFSFKVGQNQKKLIGSGRNKGIFHSIWNNTKKWSLKNTISPSFESLWKNLWMNSQSKILKWNKKQRRWFAQLDNLFDFKVYLHYYFMCVHSTLINLHEPVLELYHPFELLKQSFVNGSLLRVILALLGTRVTRWKLLENSHKPKGRAFAQCHGRWPCTPWKSNIQLSCATWTQRRDI